MSVHNLLRVYELSTTCEKEDGYAYYEKQKARLSSIASIESLEIDSCIAAFCALSPNASERNTYSALRACIGIVKKRLPESNPVVAYHRNKIKALQLLSGASIDGTLSGRKVYSFYRNTLDPDCNDYVTLDGHMMSVWTGRRLILKREAMIKPRLYEPIRQDFVAASSCVGISAPRLQSILWLTWKRLHRILWTPTQLRLWSEEEQYMPQAGSRKRDGPSTQKVMSSTPAGQQTLEFPEDYLSTGT